jgi:hypothetical protein
LKSTSSIGISIAKEKKEKTIDRRLNSTLSNAAFLWGFSKESILKKSFMKLQI